MLYMSKNSNSSNKGSKFVMKINGLMGSTYFTPRFRRMVGTLSAVMLVRVFHITNQKVRNSLFSQCWCHRLMG
jgi:hypothetical protein